MQPRKKNDKNQTKPVRFLACQKCSRNSSIFKHKRGQIIGQIFVYLAGIIIIGLIVLYGFRAIMNFKEKTDDVALINFKTTLKRTFQEMAVEYGSLKKQSIEVPSDFNKVCFVDIRASEYTESQRSGTDLCNPTKKKDYEPIVCNFWSDNTTVDNVFLVGAEQIEPLFIGDDADSDAVRGYFIIEASTPSNQYTDGYLCIPSQNGRIKFVIEGFGKGVKLSKIP